MTTDETKPTEPRVSITFTHVGYLDSIWDLSSCSECFALVSEAHECEHREWHERQARNEGPNR